MAPTCGILQVHPTRLCNLACAHCYSSSSPAQRASLAPDTLSCAVEDAAALGFSVVSLSGGEPLLYDGLGEVLRTAKHAGCRVNLVSNGALICSSRYERFADSLCIIALSLDGLAARHNAIRRSAKSFERVRLAAALLRKSGKAFGIIHTLTSESLDEVEEIAALASDWGATLLQLHPFEASGRGHAAQPMTPLSEDERVVAYVLAAALEVSYPTMKVQLDLVHRDLVAHTSKITDAGPSCTPEAPHELVVQDDGTVVPFTYGLGSRWSVTNLHRERLAPTWRVFLQTRWIELQQRTHAAAYAIASGHYGEVSEWYSVVRRHVVGAGGDEVRTDSGALSHVDLECDETGPRHR